MALFGIMDTDRSGTVSCAEFLALMEGMMDDVEVAEELGGGDTPLAPSVPRRGGDSERRCVAGVARVLLRHFRTI